MYRQDATSGVYASPRCSTTTLRIPEQTTAEWWPALGALFATRYKIRKGAGYRLAFQARPSGRLALQMANRVQPRQRRQVIVTAQEVITTLLAKALEKS